MDLELPCLVFVQRKAFADIVTRIDQGIGQGFKGLSERRGYLRHHDMDKWRRHKGKKCKV